MIVYTVEVVLVTVKEFGFMGFDDDFIWMNFVNYYLDMFTALLNVTIAYSL